MTTDNLETRLQDNYVHAFPAKQAVQVSQWSHISESWENDVYAFRLVHGPEEER